MTPLSVVIITFNEEKNIARCIRSVQSLADDIVVVDSHSADKTCEIAASLGARVIEHPFEGHIEQKNFAISQAKYPHILSLDADEALSGELAAEIANVKQEWKADAYWMNRLTSYCGQWIRHGGWYPDRKLRLWDSRKGKWGGINPHDKFEPAAGSQAAFLKGDILHYSYYSLREHLLQVSNFTEIGAASLYKAGKRSSLWKILVNPLAKFIHGYFLKAGFLDGFYGLVISIISSHATFLKYVRLRQIQLGQDS